jgi:hypothetical protein
MRSNREHVLSWGGGGRGGERIFQFFLKSTLLITALSAVPRTPLCQSKLALNPLTVATIALIVAYKDGCSI